MREHEQQDHHLLGLGWDTIELLPEGGDLALPVGLLGQWLDVRLEEVDDIDLHQVLRRRELGEGLEAVVLVLNMRKRAVVT